MATHPHPYDAIIVGGGPGGSTAAWRLAQAGKKVLVLDQKKFPRVKICAGWITPGALRLLELKPSEYPHTIQQLDGGAVIMEDQEYETQYPSTASYGIIRQEFDHYLLQRAEQAGAEVREGTGVRGVEREDDGVAVTLQDGEVVRAPVVIGAGGSGCPVSRKWGERQKGEDIILAAESETKLGADVVQKLTPYVGKVELFPEPDFYGYGWIVAKGDWINIGVGRFKGKTKNFNEDKQRFFEYVKKLGRVAGVEDRLEDFGGHSYKLYDDVPRKLSGDRFMLIGDAGGFASRWAGEGIKPAIQTAIFAADTVLEGLEKGDFSAAQTERYAAACRKEYGEQKAGFTGKILGLLPESWKKGIAAQICKRQGLRKKYIFEHAFGFEVVGD